MISPEKKYLINIHSHCSSINEREFTIENYSPKEINKDPKSISNKISIGIHPWEIDETKHDVWLKTINLYASSPNTIMIGEAGIDKLRGPDLKTQEEIFIKQLIIAKNHKKPVIIHCVRAFSELLRIRNNFPEQKWIIHGYSGNTEITKQLLKTNTYFSFGEAITINNSKASKIISGVKINRIFLETDNADISIKNIYNKTAELRNISLDKLTDQIIENYNTFLSL